MASEQCVAQTSASHRSCAPRRVRSGARKSWGHRSGSLFYYRSRSQKCWPPRATSTGQLFCSGKLRATTKSLLLVARCIGCGLEHSTTGPRAATTSAIQAQPAECRDGSMRGQRKGPMAMGDGANEPTPTHSSTRNGGFSHHEFVEALIGPVARRAGSSLGRAAH